MTINDIFKDNHKVIIIGPDRSKTEVCEAELHHLIMENKENVVVLIECDANTKINESMIYANPNKINEPMLYDQCIVDDVKSNGKFYDRFYAKRGKKR